ncbi:MAG: methyl-accepting chemotaxis protein [Pseudomonadota bacterium]
MRILSSFKSQLLLAITVLACGNFFQSGWIWFYQPRDDIGSTFWVAPVIASVVAFFGLVYGWLAINRLNMLATQMVDFTGGLSRGDLDRRLPMGRAMPCSDLASCGKPECPSFGRAAHCWVDSGSFSLHPTCPRAIKGEDCRDCRIFKQAGLNELEVLSSGLNAMLHELTFKADVAAEIARGHMDREFHVASEKDLLGKALWGMLENLNQTLASFQEAVGQVSQGADQVSDVSQALSQGAAEQAASLEEITSSMSEMESQTKSNAANASQAKTLSSQARESANNGNVQMQAMISAMSEITQASKDIAKIIKTIDDIAFQTNLLALNAAVEAARAGTQGKGFAVVAQEVRNLAGRSALAARETAELIKGSLKKVENGEIIVDKAATALGQIVDGVSRVTGLVAEIAAASSEQASGISQINIGLGQVEQVTQQNTLNAEQTAAVAEKLSRQTTELRQLIAHFTLKGQNKGRPSQAPRQGGR